MWNRLRRNLELLQLTLARACGTPDYAAYLRHECSHHPERTPLGYAEFFRARQDARYGADGPPRCC